jgi:chromosome segregation ATPase
MEETQTNVEESVEKVEKDFSQEDIDSVKNLQRGYARTTAQIGQIEVELHLLNKRLEQMKELREKLFSEYTGLQEHESNLVKSLNEKYGDGVLDLDSGKFIQS